jgi:hypothetical protein
MKLIIDIPEEEYKRMKEQSMFGRVDIWKQAIKNGTSLDDAKAEIEDLDRFYDNDYFSGNRDSMFKCNEVMQILNNIGKAESEDK